MKKQGIVENIEKDCKERFVIGILEIVFLLKQFSEENVLLKPDTRSVIR